MCRQVARLRAKHLLLFHVMSLISFLLFFVILRRKLGGGYTLMLERLKDVSFCFIKGLSVHSESTPRNIEGSEDQ